MKINSNEAFSNASNTVGIVALESPHNEKPATHVQTALLREMVEELEDRGVRDAFLWTVEGDECPNGLVATTTDEEPKLGVSVAPLREGASDQ